MQRVPSFFALDLERTEKRGIFETATSLNSECVMKNLVCLLGMLALLPAACSKDDAESPGPSYEYVSVKYEYLQTESFEGVLTRATFANDTDRECGASCSSKDSVNFMSWFKSDFFPEGDFSDCKVPLPRVNMDGELAGQSIQALPLSAGKWYDWKIPAPFSQSYTVPANSTVRESILECGFEITTEFQLTMRNPDSGEIVTVGGTWSGRQVTHMTVQVEYEDGNNMEWKTPVNWP